jgi:hypothetical protein
MGKSSGSAPSAPDPNVVASAQQSLNNNTASYNAALNNMNTKNPYGSTSYQITGYDPKTGAPMYSQDTSLNATGQAALNNQQQNQLGATGLAGTSLQNSSNLLSNPLNPQGINQQATQAAFNSNMGLIAPQEQQQTEALKAQMAAQGITDPGSQAYQQATDNLSRQQAFQNNNIANQSTLTGLQAGQMGFNQNQAAQNQALTNFGALNGQNIGMPNAPQAYQSNTQAPNIQQAYQNQYQAQLAGYNANMAQNNSITSGLFNLGAAKLMGPVSAAANVAAVAL